jgi:chaperone required for assembly of F1-ATPase
MRDILTDLSDMLSDPDPVRRAQIQMHKPLPKRFYKDVTIGKAKDGFELLLDGKPVKTPAKAKILVATEATARLLAAEWDAQTEVINPVLMPVTRLVNTAIDGIASDMDAVHADILRFAGTDFLCYRAEGPSELVDLQAEKWDPVIIWMAGHTGARFILAGGVIHQEQPASALAAFDRCLSHHKDPLKLACLHTITTLTGSAILALAFAENHLAVEDVWSLAHVDEDWQISQWGSDIDADDRRTKRYRDMVAASAVFASFTA